MWVVLRLLMMNFICWDDLTDFYINLTDIWPFKSKEWLVGVPQIGYFLTVIIKSSPSSQFLCMTCLNIACQRKNQQWILIMPGMTSGSPTSALPQWKTKDSGLHPLTSSSAAIMSSWVLTNLHGTLPLTRKRRRGCIEFQMSFETIWHPGDLIVAQLLPMYISLFPHLYAATKTESAGKASGVPHRKPCRRRR